jgi:hypothetical protein
MCLAVYILRALSWLIFGPYGDLYYTDLKKLRLDVIAISFVSSDALAGSNIAFETLGVANISLTIFISGNLALLSFILSPYFEDAIEYKLNLYVCPNLEEFLDYLKLLNSLVSSLLSYILGLKTDPLFDYTALELNLLVKVLVAVVNMSVRFILSIVLFLVELGHAHSFVFNGTILGWP